MPGRIWAMSNTRGSGNTPGTSRGSAKAPGSGKAPGIPGYTAKESDPYLRGRRDGVSDLRAAGGVSRSVVAIQVMYCLPDSFVQAYEQLFDTATSGAIGAVSGKGVEQDKGSGRATGKANGIVLGSQTGLQAQGGGKQWRTPTSFLGSDKALELKTAVDRELAGLATKIFGELLLKGTDPAETGQGNAGSPKCKGSGCGRFVKREWKYCPSCGMELRPAGDARWWQPDR